VSLADGCHPDRDTVSAISGKFSDYFYKSFDVPVCPPSYPSPRHPDTWSPQRFGRAIADPALA
jgi:hypothetical protein